MTFHKIFLFLIVIFSTLTSCSSKTDNAKKPNILIVLIDDCSVDELGCYGNKEYQTPAIDKLADNGARFETCWATPLCSPSRSLLMTGRYGFRTGWYANSMKKDIPLPKENLIFSQLAKQVGYRTAIAGKWQLPGLPPEYGFDQYCLWAYKSLLPEGVVHEGVETLDSTKYNYLKPARYWHPSILINGNYLNTNINDYGPDIQTDFLIDFMTQKSDSAFLAYYSMVLTHDPFYPTPQTIQSDDEKFGDSNQKRNFKANMEYADICIDKIMNALEKNGLSENTFIMITADNGTLGRGKGMVTENGVREPMVIYWPGKIEKQGVKNELIDFSDIFPTIADVAGAKIPDDYIHDGTSFIPLLTGGDYQEREFIFSYLDTRRLVRDKRWLLDGNNNFYDCKDNRNPRDYAYYKNVTNEKSSEVLEAQNRFKEYLKDKPAPARHTPH